MKFGTIGLPVTEQWSYHAVANVILAHSLIRSFPEVDPERTAITGISWGGYLTSMVSGLDNRFKAAVPVYGCGFLHENSVWLKDFEKMSPGHRAKWVKLWDPSSYAGSTAMPVLYVNGGKDFAYPPDSHAKTYGLVRSPKNLCFVPDLKHGHIFDHPKCIEIFIDHHLRKGTPLPRIDKPAVMNGRLTAEVKTRTKLISTKLHYTLDPLPGNPRTRKWISAEAEWDPPLIHSAGPPREAKIWFLTATDERQATVSSELNFPAVD